MVKRHSIPLILGMITIVLAACSSSRAPAGAPIVVTETLSADFEAALAATATPVLGSTPLPTVTLVPTPTLAVSGDEPPPYEPTISIPSALHLSGALIFVDHRLGIARLDFATEKVVSLYRPPERGYISSAVLSPDGQTLVMTYTPPPDPNNSQYVPFSGLYTLPADGSSDPRPLIEDAGSDNYYYSPSWSPDGRYILYGRYVYPPLQGTPETTPSGYYLDRFPFPGGPAQDFLTDILTMHLSADGMKMFYVSLDTTTFLSKLYVADPDGANAVSLLPGEDYWIIDSLAIAPDGESVVFSSISNDPIPQSRRSWLDRLMGVQIAEAHNVPSDLWIVKVGQAPQQITHLSAYGFVEDFSPDGQFIVFSCSGGVFIIQPDGAGPVQIISEPISSTLQWVP